MPGPFYAAGAAAAAGVRAGTNFGAQAYEAGLRNARRGGYTLSQIWGGFGDTFGQRALNMLGYGGQLNRQASRFATGARNVMRGNYRSGAYGMGAAAFKYFGAADLPGMRGPRGMAIAGRAAAAYGGIQVADFLNPFGAFSIAD